MKVLVTGGQGFVGSHLLEELTARGIDVRATCRSRSALAEQPTDGVEWMDCDLLDASDGAMRSIARDIDAAVHCAWCAAPGEYLTSALNAEYQRSSARLFSALRDAGCRMVTGVGTCFEYRMQSTPLDENSPTEPLTPYAEAKLATCRNGHRIAEGTMGFAWARLFYLYGPRENPRRLVAGVTRSLLAGAVADVTEGRQVRDFLHVRDAASALATITLTARPGVTNVGSGIPVTVRTIVETLGDLTGRSDLVNFGGRRENLVDPPYVCADISRLRQTGWAPRFDLHGGLEETVDWWRQC
jgi:nucleoside-diphosphate-sugar epimerase